MKRFWAKVQKTDGCWQWTACVQDGYGRFRLDGTMRLAHRVSWELEHGAIPDGLNVLHRCDNGVCVRPSHLFLGTQLANVTDCIAKGRYPDRARENNGHAKVNSVIAAEIRARHAAGESYRKLGPEYGLHWGHIGNIVRGQSWK